MITSRPPVSKLALASLAASAVSLLSLLIPFKYGGYDISRACLGATLGLGVVAIVFTKGRLRIIAVIVAVLLLLGWLGYWYIGEHLFDGYQF